MGTYKGKLYAEAGSTRPELPPTSEEMRHWLSCAIFQARANAKDLPALDGEPEFRKAVQGLKRYETFKFRAASVQQEPLSAVVEKIRAIISANRSGCNEEIAEVLAKLSIPAAPRTQGSEPLLNWTNILRSVISGTYACHYQQNTFPGESEPCGDCAHCRADKILGEGWENKSVLAAQPQPAPRAQLPGREMLRAVAEDGLLVTWDKDHKFSFSQVIRLMAEFAENQLQEFFTALPEATNPGLRDIKNGVFSDGKPPLRTQIWNAAIRRAAEIASAVPSQADGGNKEMQIEAILGLCEPE